jgi:glucosylglycerate phosphorylase
MTVAERIKEHLDFLYGEEGARLFPEIKSRLQEFKRRNSHIRSKPTSQIELSEHDAILITYGDQIREPGRPPLHTLAEFLKRRLHGVFSGVHILPFYPYSSDDGFSVIDYYAVDEALGDWEDIREIGLGFRLMFDAVINHISQHSSWFQAFLRGEAPYTQYFIEVDPNTDVSHVVRPRALPLLTRFKTRRGSLHVWTTFSEDQIDLNYGNPQVLFEIVDLILFYVERGAGLIRLDAIAYLWKEIGTASIHLPQTHRVVKLLRAILDEVAPEVILITETNVPHAENISYFGELLPGTRRTDEAQMVYQFPLAPLVLHSFHTGHARVLSEWTGSLALNSQAATFFNFTASHDGIGVRPAEGLLSREEIQNLADRALAHGGQVSYKNNPDGSQSPYELNLTWYDALNDPANPDVVLDLARFLASQVILLSLAGVPGVYVHSLFGSRNCQTCFEETGRARSLNREKFDFFELEASLNDPESREARIFESYTFLLKIRKNQPAFHPLAEQKILPLDDRVFSVLRTSLDKRQTILCLVNVSSQAQHVDVDPLETGIGKAVAWIDIIGNRVYEPQNGRLVVSMQSYQAVWLLQKG